MILNDIFQSDLVKHIEDYGNLKNFPAGETILNINFYIKHIAGVISGSIKVIRTEENGPEILLYNLISCESCIVSILAATKVKLLKSKQL